MLSGDENKWERNFQQILIVFTFFFPYMKCWIHDNIIQLHNNVMWD